MDYISRDNPAAALKWQDDIFEVFTLLGEQPGVGTRREEISTDIKTFPKGNYVVIFRIVRREVHILRVVHSARNWPKLVR